MHTIASPLLPGGAMAASVLLSLPLLGAVEPTYQKPPQTVLDVLNAPATPEVSLSPGRDRLLLLERERYPSISELAQPSLALAGVRFNPQNQGPQRAPAGKGVTIQDIATGTKTAVALPNGGRLGAPEWSPDGRQFALARHLPETLELWIVDAASGRAHKVEGLALNAVLGDSFRWLPNSRSLICLAVPEGSEAAPASRKTPSGPNAQESFGKSAPVRTYQDLLKTAQDEALFEHHATAQPLLVDATSGAKQALGKPDLYTGLDPSADGAFFLVTTVRKPFSRLLPVSGFPSEIAVWDRAGKIVHSLAQLPNEEGVPIEGVPTGPRNVQWQPTADATLVWAEALDGGDPRTKVAQRDRLLTLSAPFTGEPHELLRVEDRFRGLTWGERDGLMLVTDYDRDRRWQRTFLFRAAHPGTAPRLVWERSVRDRYRNPGTPLMRALPNGKRVMWQTGNAIYLDGPGASPRGEYPFLDRYDLETSQTHRLFQCDDHSFEGAVAMVSDNAKEGVRFITRHETPETPPNYFVRTAGSTNPLALTSFPDPAPQLRRVKKQLVTYQRADGVPLSFTLYLPPDYQPGQRLPTFVWAYPLEFNDADTAGQVSGSTNRFTSLGGASHLFLTLQGYAVLDGSTMPIVGTPEKMNDTFIAQIVSSAKAAIAKAAEMGVTDPDRVAVGGHSYGAFMTANLLAHSDLFRAGIARSGAYNRTLTPFGFQGERRTYWEAPEIYSQLSPFTHADKIKEPLLLIHGERDDNPGTFPIQSERLYQAVKGNGGNVRYVTLPFEAHGYAARESIEHTLWEMFQWLDAHVKNAPPRGAAAKP